jgi:hypothetical protein
MLCRHACQILLIAVLSLAAGTLAGCSEATSGDTSPINLNWGPHGGAQGMGDVGPNSHPGD